MFWNGSTAIDGLSGRARAGAADAVAFVAGDREHVHRPRDVLQLDLALILEGDIEPVTHLIVDLSRQGNATGISDRFDAGSNVYAVAHQIIALHNDVADMDADAQRQFPLRVGLLDCLRRLHRLHGAGELDQEAVADCLEQPSGVLGDRGLDDVRPQRLQAGPAFPPRRCPRASSSRRRRPPGSRRGGAARSSQTSRRAGSSSAGGDAQESL